MQPVIANSAFALGQDLLFAGDYEVVGPDPRLGHAEVAGLGVDMIFIHYHHRHEFEGGEPTGLWGSICPQSDTPDWDELDRTVKSAQASFRKVALYPVGWAHMIPARLGETVLDVDPEVLSDWVVKVVERYWHKVDLFPIFYEMNVFDLFFQATHGHAYGAEQKRHIVQCLCRCVEKVGAQLGPEALSKLTAGTFVELTQSSFYWMSEGKLLELPRGSVLINGALSPFDLLNTAQALNGEDGGSSRYTSAVRQLLHTLVFWNADDSGAPNTVRDDLQRLVAHGGVYDPIHNPEGFVHYLIAGWDAQPQNTYEYLLERMLPAHRVPTSAECLQHHFGAFDAYLTDQDVPEYVKPRLVGFVLDDVFKCRKQSGITSATIPAESIVGNTRVASAPVTVTDIGHRYAQLISAYKNQYSPAYKQTNA